jgi:RNA polymerase sigma factor (sigma-70 family)
VTTTDGVPRTLAARQRWSLVWSQRPRLLRIARRRTSSEQDAEDVVAEALLRAMESPEIGEERLPAWLTTVTVRLCVDQYRERAREQRLWSRAGVPAAAASCEDRVCDRSEAAMISRRLTSLPSRQAQALRLRADGHDVDGVARTLGVSYRTAESLLARGRAAARGWLVICLAAFGALAVRFARVIRISTAAKTAVVSAGVAAVGVAVATQAPSHHAGMLRPPAVSRDAPRPAAGVPPDAQQRSSAGVSRHPSSPAPGGSAAASPGASRAANGSITVNPALPASGITQPHQPALPALPSIQAPHLLPGNVLPALKTPLVTIP